MEKVELYKQSAETEHLEQNHIEWQLSKYGNILKEMTAAIDNEEPTNKIKEIDNQRRDLKADIADNMIQAFETNDPDNKTFEYLSKLYEQIMEKPLESNVSLREAVIEVYEYIKSVFDDAILWRHTGEDEDHPFKDDARNEYKRLKPIIEAYLDPQNIVSYKERREPSILEALVATARLMEIREEITKNLNDKTDAIIMAGSLNWGAFYETRGPGLSRRNTDGEFESGDFHKQYTIKNENAMEMIYKETIINDLSDVDMVVVANEKENIQEIYDTIFKNAKDPNVAINQKLIYKFKEMISDENIPPEEKPVSINFDFGTKEGFRAQIILFSNDGFQNLYSFDINKLEDIYGKGEGATPMYHEKQKVEIMDFQNGMKGSAYANIFFHPNLDYKEGDLKEIGKKLTSKEFQQALIGGKRVIGQYHTMPIGDPIPVDSEQNIYGQYMTKYYPFGGFLLEENEKYGSYFLGINPDNMILGKNINTHTSEISNACEKVKNDYFKRIAFEQKQKNNLSNEDLKYSKPDIIFGPYISRWSRLPKHQKEGLFAEFKAYLEMEEAKTEEEKAVDYYLAYLPDQRSIKQLLNLENIIQNAVGEQTMRFMNEHYLHITNFYFPSPEKINNALNNLGIKKSISSSDFNNLIRKISSLASGSETYKIKNIQRMGEKAVSLILENENNQNDSNIKSNKILMDFFKELSFSDKEIEMLFHYDGLTLKYHRADRFQPHLTIAKIDDTNKNNDLNTKSLELNLQKITQPYLGTSLRFENSELRKNS